MDGFSYSRMLLVLPPDPPPQHNLLPETFAVDETNFLTTEDGDILTTQGSDDLITSIPNPGADANTTYLAATLDYPGGSVAVLYLDLFSGDPTAGGTSILATVTGSSTRTNVASSVEATATFAENTVPIVITSASAATSTVTHIGFYTAASGGTLLVSGSVSATPPTIALGTAVTIRAPELYFDLT